MRRKTILVLGLMSLALIVLVAAGCGGDSKDSAATTEAATTEAVTTEEAATTEEAVTTEEAATTEAVTTEAAATTQGSGNDLSGIASARNCKELAELGQKMSSAMSPGAASGKDLKKAAALMKAFADKAPDDIRPDFQVYADYVTKVADAVGNTKPGSTPDAATIAKLQALATQVDSQKLSAASQHVAAWLTKNCKG